MESVRCPSCGEENPAKFRLCGFCGTSLAPPETVRCPSCGEENPGRFRLCGFCGTTLAGAAAPAPAPVAPAAPAPPAPVLPAGEVRKPATFIFVDLKGSTALTERIDQEAMSEIKRTYFTVMAAQIERHGGTIEKYIGDAIMAVFGIPRAREDDALRAVRAAHGMQQELSRLNAEFLPYYGVELANRTGVNTGEVVANIDPSANQQLATGDTVNVAARLEQAAPANEILIGETTYDLVRAHVEVEAVEPLELKGKAERVPAYRLLAVRDASVAADAHVAHRAPLIGREAEMASVRGALREALLSGGGHLITLIGEAGVGKSRLLEAAREEVADRARVLTGRCLPYGDGITFWPIVEIVRDAARIAADDSPEAARARIGELLAASTDAAQVLDRLASAVGLSATRYPVTEIFWAIRKFLEALAVDRPVLVQFEDVHSAESTFLDLVENLVETMPASASVLILCAARLPLLDKRPEWSTGERAQRIALPALADADTGALVDALLGASAAPDVRTWIVEATEGNPLFAEQLVSMLVDKGHIHRTAQGWESTDNLSTLAAPPTIQALLAARLDDLSREERATIEPAAVIGLVFPQPAVTELVPPQLRASVPAQLAALDRKQLLQREGVASDAEDEAYRFRNLLIRDATYGSLLKRARAQLHEGFVTWAERVNRERGRQAEFEEILGYHLEQAYRYRTELGPLDDHARDLGRRAAAMLSSAGRRAFDRGDAASAAPLLSRSAAVLPAADPSRIALLPTIAEALIELGTFDRARALLDEATTLATESGDHGVLVRAQLTTYQLNIGTSGTAGAGEDVLAALDEVIVGFERLGDDLGVAKACHLVSVLESTSGRYDRATEAAERVVALASRAGDGRLAARGVIDHVFAALHGTTPVREALQRCEQYLDLISQNRVAQAIVLGVLARLQAMEGQFEEARATYRRGQELIADLGHSSLAATTSFEASRVEMLAGDPSAAERELRRDYRVLEAMGETYFRSSIAPLLAHAIWAQGGAEDPVRREESARYADVARSLADADDVDSQVTWRTARAKVDAATSRSGDAVALVEDAIRMAGATQDIELRADALMDLAEVLGILGRDAEQEAPLREAMDLYTRKGDRVMAAVARSRLEELARVT